LFPDVIGHESQIQILARAAARGTPHHAWLFTGPDGVGRHKVAVAFAQALNCEGPTAASGRPCGACPACRRLASGFHPDLIGVEPEHDEKADRRRATISVDQVRELQRRLGYRIGDARHRVVIVDPADALGESGANALLKTLEEPPARTVLVLIARTEAAVLRTIRSRCQVLRFGPVPEGRIAAFLVAQGVDPAPAALRARIGAGSVGRASRLTPEALDARRENVAAFLDALEGDGRVRMAFAEGFDKDPERFQEFTWSLQALLRDAVVTSTSAAAAVHADCGDLIARLSARFPPDRALALSERLASSRSRAALNASLRGLVEELVLAG